MSAIAILPARGGSKRIPRKNIRLFAGRPAIGWPIRAARDSGCFSRIVVTTDDAEIAEAARAEGAEVPFLRDPALADDHTGTTEVIRDAVMRLGLGPDVPVCCIYATAFFVTATDLAEGRDLLASGAKWCLSAGEYRTPIDRAYRRDGARLVARDPAKMPMRSQDLEPAFFDAGQFYWARAATWSDPAERVWDGAAGVILPAERCIDIDTEADWHLAETMFRVLGLGGNDAVPDPH
ncbi:pseudaminic acid cytidylyltransferase [Defluviimonas sp. WL0050]|uniref:Pseudaminic acid cytidylyltransferase n=1 Tax=Albidovulum litorale TaxID=2984134 RepID=A0ABT2ZMW9_9RHOB|nr:pseudaminic acid cytidylyltransferase [Defluviimonas sp. WL0050]MCV2872373.1 pseudaminic acid cytidylyltransferase [Defluviimonas sp. WL0050]